MRFWVREVMGWVLVLLGLATFYICYELLLIHHIIEAGALTFIGFVLFRGGIHLLKIAVAARMCRVTQDRLYPAPVGPPPRGPARRATARRA